ncbi:DUF4405 domain-containing protein [Thermodesulfatator atlanticus]
MRKYVSLFLFWSFLVLFATGIVLFIMPHGRVAYWTGWTLLGLGKDQWQAIHIVFGILMMIFGIWHIWLNWRPLVSYLKQKFVPASPLIISGAVSIVLLILCIYNLPPVNYLINFQEQIKNSWVKPVTPPPVPHAELMPIRDICLRLGARPRDVIEGLRKRGLEVPSGRITLKELAQLNGMRPVDVYRIIQEEIQQKK